MCGIAGYWSTHPLNNADRQVLQNMLQTLHHRGPDGYGSHFDAPDGVAMGHSRLSIIDLHTGDQPLYNRDKSIVLTVNGEFYDYKSIRTKLRLDGFDFTTKSDSEIAIPLYQKYGLDFVQHLRGEFAFTLYDKNKDRLIMVRDRFGIKPLFYHISDDTVYYGSEMKAIFAHPNTPKAYSHKNVLHQLMHTMVPGTTTFEGMHALQPGHMLIIDRKDGKLEVTEKKYWDMDFPEKDGYEDKGPDYFIDLVREELMKAVQFRLEADVPVGCYLSGGIDSCSMLGLASSMQQSPVKAYTISFDNKEYDEAHIAKEMALKVGADQEQIKLAADELYGDAYVKTLWHAERTFYNTLGVAKYWMSKKVNESGYRVVVTGEGSDELFGGYPQFKRDMFLYGISEEEREVLYKQMAEKNALFTGAILSENRLSHEAFEDICGFTPSWIQPWMDTLQIGRELLHDDILDELRQYDPIAEIAQSFDTKMIKGRHELDIAQYTWSKTMLECQILNWGGDRVDMANSMESRPAFLDHHVAEAATTIPPKYRINGYTEKWVLREAMKTILPEVLYKREKFAFMAPPGHTEEKKRVKLDQLINKYLSPDAVKEVGIFSGQRIEKFLKDYKSDQDNVSLVRKDALLNHLLGVQILHNHFLK